MRATAWILVPVAVAVLAACGGRSGGEAQAQPRCYELIEGSSRTVAKVASAKTADNSEGGRITVYSYFNGKQEFEPETTAGRVEPDAFIYADGTRLALTDQKLTWPPGSLLAGAVFTSAACP